MRQKTVVAEREGEPRKKHCSETAKTPAQLPARALPPPQENLESCYSAACLNWAASVDSPSAVVDDWPPEMAWAISSK